MAERFSVLVPTYNGGSLLQETVRSVDYLDLDANACVIHVIDNASTDGSVAALPSCTPRGIPVRVSRNAVNIGRIENWNQALRIAQDDGCALACFLFVGDMMIPGARVRRLLERMQTEDAEIGVAPNVFLDAHGRQHAGARRMVLPPGGSVVPAAALARAALRAGSLFFGPLQAHVLQTAPSRRPHFEAANPSHTDQEAVFSMLLSSAGPAVLSDDPFFGWRAHAGRFHATMDFTKRVQDDLAMLGRLSDRFGVALDWPAVRASLLGQYMAALIQRGEGTWRTVWRGLQVLRAHGPVSASALLLLALRRVTGASLVRLEACR